jgi:hypothetical protein
MIGAYIQPKSNLFFAGFSGTFAFPAITQQINTSRIFHPSKSYPLDTHPKTYYSIFYHSNSYQLTSSIKCMTLWKVSFLLQRNEFAF